MEFSKSDIPKMAVTAAITALICVGLYSLFEQNTFLSIMKDNKSERISWKEADVMQKEYREFKPLKIKYVDENSKDAVAPLEGFRIDAKQLDEIINHNHAAKDSKDSTAEEVAFYLGQDGTFRNVLTNYGNIHIIAVGIKKNELMIKREETDAKTSSVFDHADPIPPNRPR